MANTRLVKITSSHDSLHTNHGSFNVNLGQTEQGCQRVRSIALIGAVIPNKIFNINSSNNVLRYNLTGAGKASLTIAVGNYTTAEIMAVIATTFTGVTITQSPYTTYINWATDAGVTLDIDTENSDALSTLAPYLGINIDIALTASQNVDSSNIPDLNGTDMFLIESTRLAPSNLVNSAEDSVSVDKPVIAIIPVTVAFGYNEVFVDQGNLEQTRVTYHNPRNITAIDIRITDSKHRVLDLQSEVTLIFRVYF